MPQLNLAHQPETQNTNCNTSPKGNKSKEDSNHLTGEDGRDLSPLVKIFLLTVSRWCFFCGSFLLFVSCLSCFLVCSLQPCGHLLGQGEPFGSLVCDVSCLFVTFPCDVLGQVCYLIVSNPNLCLLPYFFVNSGLFNIIY